MSTKPAELLSLIIKHINNTYLKDKSFKMKFDELKQDKESICLTTSDESVITEREIDVTGSFIEQSITFSIIYRVVGSSIRGNTNLSSIAFLDDIVFDLKSTFYSIGLQNALITEVNQSKGSFLDIIYDGGIKDFKTVVEVKYIREKN